MNSSSRFNYGIKKVALSFTFLFLVGTFVYAVGPFIPGGTLDPDCNPGDVDCVVDPLWIRNDFDDFLTNIVDNVGIGTATPSARLHVDGDALTNPLLVSVDGAEHLRVSRSGTIRFNDSYDFPTSDGDTGQVLTTDGLGVVSWEDAGGLIGVTSDVGTETWLGDTAGDGASTAGTVFLGVGAGYLASSAGGSVFVGAQAGNGATNAFNSNFLGANAGQGATGASSSNFFGPYAGNGATGSANSFFAGANAGRYNAGGSLGSNEAANSIFIGNNAGYKAGDFTLDNVGVAGTSILIGDDTSTGGFSNSIAIGKGATNTATNQFLIDDSYTQFNMRGINWTMPAAQGSSNTFLKNDGNGNLTWAGTGSSYQLYIENSSSPTTPVASGANSVALGSYATAAGTGSFATGVFSNARSGNEIALGMANTTYVPASTTSWDAADRLLVVGKGFNNPGSGDDAFTILKNGEIGVGYDNFETNSINAIFQVNGSISQTSATSCSVEADADGILGCAPSDQKLKSNIEISNYGLEEILALKPVTYNFIDTEKFGSALKIGFIAQDLEKVIPEVVTEGPEYKSVNYGLITPVLTKAVQELNTKVDLLFASSGFSTDTLLATISELISDAISKIKDLSVETIAAVNGTFESLTSKNVKTEELCIGATCVTETQLIQLLENQNIQTSGSGDDESGEVEDNTPSDDTPADPDPAPEEDSETTPDDPAPEEVPAPDPAPEV